MPRLEEMKKELDQFNQLEYLVDDDTSGLLALCNAYAEELEAARVYGEEDVERVAIALHKADDLGARIPWGTMAPIGLKQRIHYTEMAKAAIEALSVTGKKEG